MDSRSKDPLSQLRYGNESDKVWGLQINRRLFRKEERSYWQHIPQNSGVWVSRFGELHGLKTSPCTGKWKLLLMSSPRPINTKRTW
ncbi:hypothetical protein [Paraflavitalea speifideaquila]|uniref:hypothetical protein n=1 Tax=Paraflavitalea speifideaquila TaxID=3076558 RepID=UPI0028EBE342|nr:hypothetical protein [Paraflavitalea speifideiaquila]